VCVSVWVGGHWGCQAALPHALNGPPAPSAAWSSARPIRNGLPIALKAVDPMTVQLVQLPPPPQPQPPPQPLGFPRNRGGFLYAASGWMAAIFSYSTGGSNPAELWRRRVL
jgi:hypothetical protein